MFKLLNISIDLKNQSTLTLNLNQNDWQMYIDRLKVNVILKHNLLKLQHDRIKYSILNTFKPKKKLF